MKMIKSLKNLVRNIFFVLGAIFVLTIVLAAPIKSWFYRKSSRIWRREHSSASSHDYMAEMFLNDARLAFFFSAAVFGLMFADLKSFVSRDLMITAIIGWLFIDIFRINHRGETLKDNAEIDQLFQKPEYVSAIESLNDKSTFKLQI